MLYPSAAAWVSFLPNLLEEDEDETDSSSLSLHTIDLIVTPNENPTGQRCEVKVATTYLKWQDQIEFSCENSKGTI